MNGRTPIDAWIDELERDLGQAAALRLIANAGGQRRDIPKRAAGSRLANEVGEDVVIWSDDARRPDRQPSHPNRRDDAASDDARQHRCDDAAHHPAARDTTFRHPNDTGQHAGAGAAADAASGRQRRRQRH